MSRRTIIIGSVIIGLLIIAVSAFFIFFKPSGSGIEVDQNPFGTGAGDVGSSTTPPVLDEGVDFSGEAGTEVAPRLIKITDAPVAYGVTSLFIPEIPAATSTDGIVTPAVPPDVEVRFVERQSGNVYAYRTIARTLTRISNQTIPGVHDAVWLANGSEVYLRYASDTTGADTIETYALPLIDGVDGFTLEQNLNEVAATSSSAILSLRGSTTGSIVTVAKPDGSDARTAFSSPLADYVVSFFGKNYLAVTRPSASVDGYAFQVSGTNGGWSRLVGPLRGLSALPSPTGTTALYSYVNRGTLTTNIIDVATHTSIPLPIATLAEKCVYSNDGSVAYCAVPKSLPGTLPDDWYQGVFSFSDRIWKIDLTARAAFLVVDPSTVGNVDIDAVSLSLDPHNDFLTFTNRSDGSLWVYDL